MKLRIVGYILVLSSFFWAMSLIWPSLYGQYPFMPPREYRVPKDTGEMVSKAALFRHAQTVRELSLDEQANMLYPILLMLSGALMLDLAGRRQRRL
jgi:hypothetical protein